MTLPKLLLLLFYTARLFSPLPSYDNGPRNYNIKKYMGLFFNFTPIKSPIKTSICSCSPARRTWIHGKVFGKKNPIPRTKKKVFKQPGTFH
jgi:hypothetical protein